MKFTLKRATKTMLESTLSLTLALGGGRWLTPRPDRFTPEKETRYPLCRRMGGSQARYGWVPKISTLPEFDPRNVQPAACRYTDWAIPANLQYKRNYTNIKNAQYKNV